MAQYSSDSEILHLRTQVEELQKRLSVCQRALKRSDLNRAEEFYREVEGLLAEQQDVSYCMIHIDIERFKLFNEWYGRDEGDSLIRHLEENLLKKADQCSGLGVHLTADTFALLLPADHCNCEKLEPEILGWMKGCGHEDHFLPVVGVYPILNHQIAISTMCDRAALAADSVKGNYAHRIAVYNETMGRSMAQEQALLVEFRRALQNNEFILYAQPKCNLRTGKMIGSEILVRWKHPRRGLLTPGEFIPLLERNNLILELDVYVWEETCRLLRHWIDQGCRALPVSVNVSRVDVYDLDLCGLLTEMIQRYEIDPSLLELEITETSYTQETEQLVGVVRGLREQGFTVLMDDFGSGYSSLNMLKEVDVDILKLDLRFLKMNVQNQRKGNNILESVMQMAKWMEMRVIAEGVETKEEVDFLLCIGCEYGQGYYFYRPLPIDEFEAILRNPERVDYRGMVFASRQAFRLDEMISSNAISDAFLNNLLGGVAIYDLYENHLTLLQVNEGYYRATGCNPVDLEMKKNNIGAQVHPDDWKIVLDGLREAEDHPLLGSEIEFRRYRLNGDIMWMHLRLFFIGEQDRHRRFYASVSDVTNRKDAEEELRQSQQELKTLMNISSVDATLRQMQEENRLSAISAFAGLIPAGMIGCYLEPQHPLFFANQEMMRMTKDASYADFFQRLGGFAVGIVHPDDRMAYIEAVGRIHAEGQVYHVRYRLLHQDESWNWVMETGRAVCGEDQRLALVCVCLDIGEQVALEQSFDRFLKHTPSEIFRLRNNRYEFFSTNLAQKLGYSQQEYQVFLNEKNGAALTCSEDRPLIWEAWRSALENNADVEIVFRTTCKDGSFKPLSMQATRGEDEQGGLCYYGVLTDMTDIIQAQERLDASEKKLRIALRQARLDVWEYDPTSRRMRIMSASKKRNLFGLPSNTAIENFPEQLIESGVIAPESRQTLREFANACLQDKRDITVDLEILLPQGNSRWIRMLGDGLPAHGDFLFAIGSIRDVTAERRQSLSNLENSKFLEALSEQSALNWRINLSQDGSIGVTGGEAWNQRSGVDEDTEFSIAVAKVGQTVIEPEDREPFSRFLNRDRMLEDYRQGIKTDALIYRRRLSDETRWAKIVYHLVELEGTRDIYAYIYVIDIDDEKKQEQALLHRAERDSLTGLYNRQAAFAMIETAIEQAIVSNRTAALFMVDLDHFKLINDSYGHVYGDAVLSETAAKLREAFREQDIVCRLGGDEFVAFCCNISREDALKKAWTLCQRIERIYTAGDRRVHLSASIGIAMFPEAGHDFSVLYDRADIALYQSKSRGKNDCCCYEPRMRRVHPRALIVRDEATMQKEFSNYISEYIFKMLYESTDPQRAVRSVLELTASHFKSQCAHFVVCNTKHGNRLERNVDWYEEGSPSLEEDILELFANQSEALVGFFSDRDVVSFDAAQNDPPVLHDFAKRAGLSAMTMSHISMGEWGDGFLCFANCKTNRPSHFDPRDRDQIKVVGEIIALFIQRHLSQTRQELYATVMETLLNRRSSAIYVINQSREIIYYNQSIRNLCPNAETGRPCYESLLGRENVCSDCLLADLFQQDGPLERMRQLPYGEGLCDAKISADWLDLPQQGRCIMLKVDLATESV